MPQYQIIIEETVADDFTVEANSPQEAQYIAEQMYKSGEFVIESGEVQQKRIAVNASDCENIIDFEEF